MLQTATLSAIAMACHAAMAQEAPEPTTLPKVVVRSESPSSARPGGQVTRGVRAGLLGDLDAMDTPFNVVGFTGQTIANQQAATVTEVLANDPSVRVSAPGTGLLDAFYVRGFPVNEGNVGEMSLDGVPGVAPNYRIFTEYVERVELVKGTTALLNGMSPNGGIGGSVNVVPKRAPARPVTQAGVDVTSHGQAAARFDVARRFGEQGEFGARVNLGLHDGDTGVDKQARRAQVGALALDYQGGSTRATLDLLHQAEHFDAPVRPVFLGAAGSVPTTPAAPDNTRNLTQAWEFSDVRDRSALLRVDHAVSDRFTLFGAVGAAETTVDRLFGNPTVSAASGDVTWTPQRFNLHVHRQSAQAGARYEARTGAVEHALTVQASTYRDRLGRATRNGVSVASNLGTPADTAPQDIAPAGPVATISATTLNGLAVSDTLSMLDRSLLVSAGVRLQRVQSDNHASTGTITQQYDDHATTPLLGVVFKPWGNTTSLYANYIEGLAKGDVAPSTAANAGAAMAPYRARQVEVGIKVDQGDLVTTAALFQIRKASGQLTDNVYAADGEQTNRGLELGVEGRVGTSARVLAGFTWIDAEVTGSSNPAVSGKQPIGVPRAQATLTGEWDTAWTGFSVNAGLAYASRQQVDAANLRSIPSWTRLDAGARWQTTLAERATTFRLNVRNLTDRSDWVAVSSFGGLVAAAPRTVELSATVDF